MDPPHPRSRLTLQLSEPPPCDAGRGGSRIIGRGWVGWRGGGGGCERDEFECAEYPGDGGNSAGGEQRFVQVRSRGRRALQVDSPVHSHAHANVHTHTHPPTTIDSHSLSLYLECTPNPKPCTTHLAPQTTHPRLQTLQTQKPEPKIVPQKPKALLGQNSSSHSHGFTSICTRLFDVRNRVGCWAQMD